MILYLTRCCPHARATYECALSVSHRCRHCARISSPVCGWPVGERQMPQTMETQPTLDDAIASCQATANALNQTIRVNIGGIDMEFSPASTEPAQKPKATKPKAKATPTKRKRKAKENTFHRDVIVGKRQNRLKIRNWRATKTSNMHQISQKVAEAHGWSSSKTGKITQKGRKAQPKRTVTWS